MKILSINCVNQQQNVRSGQSNFRGLWGNVSSDSKSEIQNYGIRDIENIYETNTKEYFPFLDETEESLNKQIVKWTSQSHDVVNNYAHENGQPDLISRSFLVKIMDRLPIKVNEWAQYSIDKLKMSAQDRHFVEETLRRYNLKNYIR